MLPFFHQRITRGWVPMAQWVVSLVAFLYRRISLRTLGWGSSGWSEGWRSYGDSHNSTSEWASNDSAWKPSDQSKNGVWDPSNTTDNARTPIDQSKNSVQNPSNTPDNAWKPIDQRKSSAWSPSNTPNNAWSPIDQSKSKAWNPSNTSVYTPMIPTFPKCPPILPTYPPIPTPPITPIHQCYRRRRCCGVYQP